MTKIKLCGLSRPQDIEATNQLRPDYIGFVFAPQVVALFRKGDAEVLAFGALALRLQCVSFPFVGWTTCLNMLQQNIGKSRDASILSAARQGVFFLPLILVLPHFLSALGIQLSQPISDLLTFALSIPMGIALLRELREKDQIQQAQQRQS